MNCIDCEEKDCKAGKNCTRITRMVVEEYNNKGTQRLMKVASRLEADYYMEATRLEELIRFSREMNYRKLGVAFCVGFDEEARKLKDVLASYFKIYSVCCKVCGIDKDHYQLPKLREGTKEAMCNPIGQAIILNRKKTDLNIILGLCIGHDILFTQQSQAPVTTLVVKDRVLAHNPVGALYSRYWRRKIRERMDLLEDH